MNYLNEADVLYRTIDNVDDLRPEEILGRYARYYKGKKLNEVMVALVRKNDLYKLVNEWNRRARLNAEWNWYYEGL